MLVLAADEARLLSHNYLGTEHLLLGLIAEKEGMAAKSLEGLEVSLEGVRSQVGEVVGKGKDPPKGQPPFTPRARKVLEMSFKEALQLGHNYIGTEHILLGLVREGEGVAVQILVKQGVTLGKVREEVFHQLRLPAPVEVSESKLSATERVALRLGGPISRALESMGISVADILRGIEKNERKEDVLKWLREGYPIARALESFGIPLAVFRKKVEEFLAEEEPGEEPPAEEPPA